MSTSNNIIVRKFVVVGVAVIKKRLAFDEKSAGIDTRAVAAIPTRRRVAYCFLQARDRAIDMLTLLLLAKLEVFDPPPAVTANVVSGRLDCPGRLRLSLQSQRASKNGAPSG
jgi:hypothetical protein